MINRDFWKRVAGKWSTTTDGIDIPDTGPISDDLGLDSDIDDVFDELDDILADIDI